MFFNIQRCRLQGGPGTRTTDEALDDNMAGIDILPYHRLGLEKYEARGRCYSIKELQPPEPGHLVWVKSVSQELGCS